MLRLRSVLSFFLVLWTVAVASGQINFIQPAATTISPRPEFLAVADFNGDNRPDLAVSSPRSHEVNILLSNPDGVLTPGTVFRLGNLLNGITAGDINQDGRPDIIVAVERSRGVFIMINNGAGSFAAPALRLVGQNPTAVALGDFDGVNGADLAVADRTANRVFILTNDGRPSPNFRPAGDYQTGEGPKEILAGDFNGDNALDLVTLNLGGTRVADVTVLLFQRVAQELPIFTALPNFGVGERPSGMILGDFNEDEILDVALVNRPFASFFGEIEFLFGRGDGFLLRVDSLDLPCPFFTGDLGCRPYAVAAGDFNADGHVDLAVTQVDPRDIVLGDIMSIFVGRGEGFYAPGPIFTTGPVPGALVAADMAGNAPAGNPPGPDGLIDIAVASDRLSTIQIYVNRSTAEGLGDRLPGQRCSEDGQCTTGVCADDVCCRAECLETEICNVPGLEGTCQPLDDNRPLGFPCETPEQCQSGFCTHNTCCVAGTCPEGARCDLPDTAGTCTPVLDNGEECETNDHCRSTNCVDGFCCNTDCLDGVCDMPEQEGQCIPFGELGDPCTRDGQCLSGVCDLVELICCADICDANEVCSSDGASCVPNQNTPQITPGSDGAPCTRDNDCDSGFCTDRVCCQVEECADDEFCEGGTGECVFGTPSPSPTPTDSGPATPTAPCPSDCTCVGGVVACAGRSGGCSTTGGSGATPSEVFLALLLPIVLYLARRSRVAAVERRGIRGRQ